MFNKFIISILATTLLGACTITPYTTSADFTYHSNCRDTTYAIHQHHIHSDTPKTVLVSKTVINNNVNTTKKRTPNIHYAKNHTDKKVTPNKRPQAIRIARNDLRRNITPIINPTPITHKTDKNKIAKHKSDNKNHNNKHHKTDA